MGEAVAHDIGSAVTVGNRDKTELITSRLAIGERGVKPVVTACGDVAGGKNRSTLLNGNAGNVSDQTLGARIRHRNNTAHDTVRYGIGIDACLPQPLGITACRQIDIAQRRQRRALAYGHGLLAGNIGLGIRDTDTCCSPGADQGFDS